MTYIISHNIILDALILKHESAVMFIKINSIYSRHNNGIISTAYDRIYFQELMVIFQTLMMRLFLRH